MAEKRERSCWTFRAFSKLFLILWRLMALSTSSQKETDREHPDGPVWFLESDAGCGSFICTRGNSARQRTVCSRITRCTSHLALVAEAPNVFTISHFASIRIHMVVDRVKAELRGTFFTINKRPQQTLRERRGCCSLNFPSLGQARLQDEQQLG